MAFVAKDDKQEASQIEDVVENLAEFVEENAPEPAEGDKYEIDPEYLEPVELEEGIRDPNMFLRASTLLPMEKMEADQVRIIGVGGIGRQVALQVAAVGVGGAVLYDADDITIHNISSQGYPYMDIGSGKVSSLLFAMQEIVPVLDEFIGYANNFPLPEGGEIIEGDRESGPTFCCVDKISERAKIFEAIGRCPLWIDGRMAAETGRVITILRDEPDDMKYYKSTLFPQKDQEPEQCTSKATIYCGNFIAAIMVAQYTKWIRGEIKVNDICRDMMFSLKTFELYPYKPTDSKKSSKSTKSSKKAKKGGGKDKDGAKRKRKRK